MSEKNAGLSLNELRDLAFETSKKAGWHDPGQEPTFGDRIALISGEGSEALEDFRAGRGMTEIFYTRKVPVKYFNPLTENYESGEMDIEVPEGTKGAKPCGIPTELADIIIRVLDLAGKEGIDIQAAVEEKMAFNATRPHRHGGKKL